jgi:hypothetical protein
VRAPIPLTDNANSAALARRLKQTTRKPPKPKKAQSLAELTPKDLVREPERGLVPNTENHHLDAPFNAFLDEIKPQTNMRFQQALASSTDIRFQTMLQRMKTGITAKWSVTRIAKSCGLTLPEIADMWMSAQKMQQLARAQTAAGDVIDDMAIDAKSGTAPCPRCDGYGTVLSDRETKPGEPMRVCPECKGNGTVRRPGDHDARKLILEVAGMAGKKGGVNVHVNQNNFGGASIESAVGRMNKVSFDIEVQGEEVKG